MRNFWRDNLEHSFQPPESRLGLDEILQEAHDVYWGSLGVLLTMFQGQENNGEVDQAKLEGLDQILQGEQRVVTAANDCYDYAINGRIRLASTGAEETQMNDRWGSLAILVLAARPGIEVFAPHVRGREMLLPQRLEHILLHALVRARLDLATHPKFQNEDALPMFLSSEGNLEYLTLKEIALLGQMSERAVRNAAQPTAADQLKTRKEQNQTVVDAHEALRWLKGRRGFVATRVD